MPQTLTEIRALLSAYGLRPKRSLGQNFLHDGNQMSRVVAAAQLQQTDTVLEVGPGTGGLTQRLLDAGVCVVAVELDAQFEMILRQQLTQYDDRVRLVMGDVLASKHQINPEVIDALKSTCGRGGEFKGEGGRGGEGGEGGEFKLVANLPYQVASPLLINLVTQGLSGLRMTRAVVMVQREVADRLCAAPGGKQYGALSVLVGAMCEVELVGKVSPACFWPRPKVESAIVRLVRRDKPLTDDVQRLGETVALLFGQRRKQIGTILGRQKPMPNGIDPSARPEQLTVEQLVLLGDWLYQSSNGLP